jgi:NAD(P)-dependent dehydrogenase (short-subunit alcohol dehydrogenase family)
MELEGRLVVVTGAASGIGRALARAAAGEGARLVVAVDRDAAGAASVAAELGERGASIGADLSREDEVVRVVEEVEAEHGPIDLFCSNAGVLSIGGVELPDEEWRRVLDVNVMAHLWAARALVPRMLGRGGGYLLTTASAAGLLAQVGSAPYSVSKHAAVALAEWLSITYGHAGLTVSALCPQAVATAMLGGHDDGGVAGLDGVMSPEEVAAAAIDGIRAERFLILPHPEVAEYERRRATDRERWLEGMRRLNDRFAGLPAGPEGGAGPP